MPILGSQGSGAKGAPATPVIETATVTNSTTISLTFTSPSSKLPITAYTVTSNPSISLSTSGTTSPLTVTGSFASNTAYTFTLTATNANGTSTTSAASSSVTPSPISYWINTLDFAGGQDYGHGIIADSSENVYMSGHYSTVDYETFLTTKYNSSGTLQWQKSFQSGTGQGLGITFDSSGNVYSAGYYGGSAHVAKYNSSGTLQWQKVLASTPRFRSLWIDSSNNLYLTGSSTLTSNRILSIKLDSSGNSLWQRQLYTGSSSASNGYADSSGNNYVCGSINAGSNGIVAKYDSSGNLQWQRTIGFEIVGVVADSSGNVYGITNTNILVKWNSSGTLQWKYTFTTTTPSFANNDGGVFIGSNGSVFVAGALGDNVGIIKLNSSGVPQWARQIAAGNALYNYGGIYLDANDTIYISGTYRPATTDYKIYIAKLPGDGSKTGTYTVGGVSYTYSSVTTPGTATSAAADGTGSATTATPALTLSNNVATNTTPSLTSATTTI
jgi:hypothetical protein